jgi:hypothetical protein
MPSCFKFCKAVDTLHYVVIHNYVIGLVEGPFQRKPEKLHELIYSKNIYSTMPLTISTHYLLYAVSNIPLRHKFFGRRSLVVAVPASHVPPLPPHLTQKFFNVECLLGVKRSQNCWMPNLVNMVDAVTPPILYPESVSQYNGLYEVGHDHAAGTHHRATNQGIFFELVAKADSEAHHCTFHCLILCICSR